jgi:DNA-binding protein Fis
MRTKKLPTHVELLRAADNAPLTKAIELEVAKSLSWHLREQGFFASTSDVDADAQIPELLLHYRYAVDSAVVKTLLKHTDGNQARAARILGINRSSMRHLLHRLNLSYEDFR